MSKLLVMLFLSALLMGCAERFLNGKGAEMLVYPETHVYEFTVKTSQQSEEKLNQLFDAVEEIDSGASYTIEYRNAKSKKVLDKVLSTRPTLPLSAEYFSLNKSSAISSDIKMTITYHDLVTQTCLPSQIEQENMSRNCFSEVARSKQIAHKERIVEGL